MKKNLVFILNYIAGFETKPKTIYLNPERYAALIKELDFKTNPVKIKGVIIKEDPNLPPGKDRHES